MHPHVNLQGKGNLWSNAPNLNTSQFEHSSLAVSVQPSDKEEPQEVLHV